MIEVIFFDFDGVIVESVDIKTNAFAKLFKHEGNDVVKEVIDYHLNNGGISRYEKFKYIYGEILKRPLNDDEFQSLCNKFADLVVDDVINAPYVKGAKEFLENYSSIYKCFVVSATPQKEMEEIIERRNISHYFKAIYGSPTQKSDIVRNVLVREDVDRVNVLYVGDAINDFIAAKDNSVNFIARINKNESIFANIDCIKLNDLTNLDTMWLTGNRLKWNR